MLDSIHQMYEMTMPEMPDQSVLAPLSRMLLSYSADLLAGRETAEFVYVHNSGTLYQMVDGMVVRLTTIVP